MESNIEVIQNEVLFVLNRGGYCPGAFMENLIKAVIVADHDNTERLRQVFPETVGAVRAYQTGRNIDCYPLIKKAVEDDD